MLYNMYGSIPTTKKLWGWGFLAKKKNNTEDTVSKKYIVSKNFYYKIVYSNVINQV